LTHEEDDIRRIESRYERTTRRAIAMLWTPQMLDIIEIS
jgi:hypothetical protein